MLHLARARTLLLATVAAPLFAAIGACPVVEDDPPGEVERRSFTTNVADEIVVPRLERFVTLAAALRVAADAHAASGGDDVADGDAARAAWRDAMNTWQELEVMHLGPAALPPGFVGAAGMRDRIYAWPQTNLCALDAQILLGEFEEDGWVETRLPNVVGLAALEYTLFVDGTGNACPDTAGMNTNGTWDALGADEIRSRRARYAAVVAADVEAKAAALRDAWTAPDVGFAAQLRNAGEAGSAFATAQQALDEIFAALFAIELVTKDLRLGIPAGVHVDCEAETCPERVESGTSRTSKENVIANLVGTRAVFLGIDANGEDDTGFDDLLRERGADDVAATMTANLDAAIAAARAFEGTIEDALVTEPARVVELHAAVKLFSDDFKSTFPSTLGLRVPDEGAGDND